MRVLIAGCGYVGSRLAELMAAEKAHEIYCLRRTVPGSTDAAVPVRWLAADLVAGPLDALPAELDAVVFAAAPGGGGPEAYEAVYVRALGRLIAHVRQRACSRPTRFVLTSSTSVYGQTHGEWVDESTPATSPQHSGRLVREGEALLGEGDVAVRLGGIYGPGRTAFIDAVRLGKMTVNPRQSAFTNRIHRDDAAAILRHVLTLPSPEKVYNGVDSAPAPRAEVARWLAERLGVALRESDAEEETSFLRGNKRVRNDRLLASGYQLVYPTYREGYEALLRGASSPA